MRVRFGTDGIRGLANVELSPELVLAIGAATARTLGGAAFLVGRDTRESGPLLSAALSAGVASEGLDVVDLGVISTPALAYLAAKRGLVGAMISASHNPYRDNGVKIISSRGSKLDDASEAAIEEELDDILSREEIEHGLVVGSITVEDDAWREYAEHLVSIVHLDHSRPLRVVCDCANGAASAIVPFVLDVLGVENVVIHAQPDGKNINERCGSTHPESLQQATLEHHADLGLSFDGDGDRLIAVDEQGALVDGDQLLAMFALDIRDRGALDNDAIAITVMSNLGLRQALVRASIGVIETAVGDRYVLDAIESNSLALGGEQSGHIIFRHDATTGDGI